uniref:Probable tRNA pseudouridine synthase 2 n=1 Tax=Phallusia mammillata TaxID=59560 RepID=A0A6F9DVX7_9ASCI|nr:probable tRNA pseudouridine synthase 2 [Phallusia mammillata]
MSLPVTYAPKAFRWLNGIFAVYKPADVPHYPFVSSIVDKLVLDINSLEQRPQKKRVVFKRQSEIEDSDHPVDESNQSHVGQLENTLKPVCVPDWFDHPLVQGPRFRHSDFELLCGTTLDVKACGVLVVGLKDLGSDLIKRFDRAKLPRKYLAHGHLGLASLSATGETKIVERSTWQHVTADKIARILMHIQGTHRKASIRQTGVDLSTQKAYELALEGLLKPQQYCGPIILDLKLVEFKPPKFGIEVTCIDEACSDIRRLIHEIGLILKTNAICTYVQRQQDGPFLYDDPNTLLLRQINVQRVLESMTYFRHVLTPGMLKRHTHFRNETLVLPDPVSKAPTQTLLTAASDTQDKGVTTDDDTLLEELSETSVGG